MVRVVVVGDVQMDGDDEGSSKQAGCKLYMY